MLILKDFVTLLLTFTVQREERLSGKGQHLEGKILENHLK